MELQDALEATKADLQRVYTVVVDGERMVRAKDAQNYAETWQVVDKIIPLVLHHGPKMPHEHDIIEGFAQLGMIKAVIAVEETVEALIKDEDVLSEYAVAGVYADMHEFYKETSEVMDRQLLWALNHHGYILVQVKDADGTYHKEVREVTPADLDNDFIHKFDPAHEELVGIFDTEADANKAGGLNHA